MQDATLKTISRETHPATSWFYWELGLLCSLWAIWSTPVERIDYGAYGVVTFLFLWGLIRH